MDWDGNSRSLGSRPDSSLNFLYTYNADYCRGIDFKHMAVAELSQGMAATVSTVERNNYGMINNSNNHEMKKKRLRSDQLESLERSFQEEIKLDPERKMKLSKELGLQPRQIAVWFQNRRARWKSKQMELLYDALKQEFEVISREKLKLQEEVMKLKAMLREEASKKQVSTAYTDVSGEETVESTSVTISRGIAGAHCYIPHSNNHLFHLDDYNILPAPYWHSNP